MIHTTFRLVKKEGACEPSYKKFAKHVGGIQKYGLDTPIPLTEVLDVLGLADALWCLQATIEGSDKIARLLSCIYAEHALPNYEQVFPDDPRVRDCIDTSRRYANGQATLEELTAAWRAADSAARRAANSARSAWRAWVAADSAAKRDADSAAWSAAESAADSAAEREWQANKFREYMEATDE